MIEDDVLKSTYQSANIYKGIPHEVVVRVTAEGCVLTWDFDILKVSLTVICYCFWLVMPVDVVSIKKKTIQR